MWHGKVLSAVSSAQIYHSRSLGSKNQWQEAPRGKEAQHGKTLLMEVNLKENKTKKQRATSSPALRNWKNEGPLSVFFVVCLFVCLFFFFREEHSK